MKNMYTLEKRIDLTNLLANGFDELALENAAHPPLAAGGLPNIADP